MRNWKMSRREVLRGGGLALSLPFLNSMNWAKGSLNAQVPKRMLVSYIAYGVYDPMKKRSTRHPWSWYPRHDSGPLEFANASAPFKGLEKDITYLRGLDHKGGYGLGGHSSGDVFSTGADMSGLETTNNISIDQMAAKVQGHHTRYSSLALGSEGGTGSYGMSKTLSHKGPGKPVPSMHRPQEIFNLMFRPYANKSVYDIRSELKREASALDLMMENYKTLHGRLGVEDRQKMDEYLDSVRTLEKRLERSNEWIDRPLPKVDTEGLNLDVSYDFPEEYIRSMYDLLFLAFQTDSTRFATFMLESEHSTGNTVGNFANRIFGHEGATHSIAHGRPLEPSKKWEVWRAEQHAYFLNRLKNTAEGEGSLLDNTLVLWGSAHPHGSHSPRDYPIQLAGGSRLGLKHGNLHAFSRDEKVPLSNLFVTMLNAVDIPVEKFADSTNNLPEILA